MPVDEDTFPDGCFTHMTINDFRAERTARTLSALDAIYEMHDGQEQDDPEYDLMAALAKNRRAEGRVF